MFVFLPWRENKARVGAKKASGSKRCGFRFAPCGKDDNRQMNLSIRVLSMGDAGQARGDAPRGFCWRNDMLRNTQSV